MTLNVRTLGFRILLGIAVYLPFEDYVLRWMPGPTAALAVVRQVPDVLVWLVALTATALHLADRGTLRVIGQRTDRYLLAFLGVIVVGIGLNEPDPMGVIAGLKVFLRYIPLIYALIMLAPRTEDLDRVQRAMLWAIGLQAAIGLIEWVGGTPARLFFSVIRSDGTVPAGSAAEFVRIAELHDVTGTMPRAIAFAYFILVGLAVWLVAMARRPAWYWSGAVLTLLLTYGSGSRMAVFAAVLLVLMHQVAVRGFRPMLGVSLLVLPLAGALVVGFGPQAVDELYVLDVFTEEYQEHARTQRLSIFLSILPHALDGGVKLFGYTPDMDVVTAAIAEHFELPPVFTVAIELVLEDVYWVALLLYYGFVGVACLLLFYGKLTALQWRLVRRPPDARTHDFALVALLLLLLAVLLNFINQTFEVRQYSYYQWFYVGLALAAALRAGPAAPHVVDEAAGGP